MSGPGKVGGGHGNGHQFKVDDVKGKDKPKEDKGPEYKPEEPKPENEQPPSDKGAPDFRDDWRRYLLNGKCDKKCNDDEREHHDWGHLPNGEHGRDDERGHKGQAKKAAEAAAEAQRQAAIAEAQRQAAAAEAQRAAQAQQALQVQQVQQLQQMEQEQIKVAEVKVETQRQENKQYEIKTETKKHGDKIADKKQADKKYSEELARDLSGYGLARPNPEGLKEEVILARERYQESKPPVALA
jgi:hypothetical protein